MDGDDQNRFGRRRTRKIAPGGSVTRTIPPQALIDAINPLVRRLATSPLHRAVDSSVLLLHVTGRRTKRLYSIPVGYVAFDERLLIVTQHAWRANLRGGADVEITLGGRRRAMRANLDEAPESVAATCGVVIERCGWPEARRRLGISTRSGKAPSAAELVEGAREHNLAIVSCCRPTVGPLSESGPCNRHDLNPPSKHPLRGTNGPDRRDVAPPGW